MSVLDRVRDRLNNNYRDLRYTEADCTITVHAPVPNGFDVSVTEGLVVAFDGWHEHFDDENNALDCFAFGFSDQCRLKVSFRGTFPCNLTLESLEDGRWVKDSTTGLLLFPFWRPERVEYRQNAISDSSFPLPCTQGRGLG